MTKSTESVGNEAHMGSREVRPFLFLEAARASELPPVPDPAGLERLAETLAEEIPALARSLVNFSIALQNRSMLERGNRQPIQLSVLNRRRRAARAWLNAIAEGRTDPVTARTVATQWLPVLCASGPEPCASAALGRKFVEFLRGAITALLFAEPADNLLPHARALHALETVLGEHLGALERAVVSPTN